MNKVLNKTAGAALMTAGVASTLAKYGLSAAAVVCNGGKNLANAFAPSPVELGFGFAAFESVQKGFDKLGSYLMKQGRKVWYS